MPQVAAITSAQMWSIAAVVAVIDVVLAVVLTRWLRPGAAPRLLAPALLVLGTCGFAALYAWGFRTYWDSCYGAVLGSRMGTVAPLLGAVVGAFGWLFWWIARRVARWPVPLFLGLGALESLPGHLNAIYRHRLLEHCLPVLGISSTSALVFAFFEFGFYWSVILGVAALVARALPTVEKQHAPRRWGAGGGRE